MRTKYRFDLWIPRTVILEGPQYPQAGEADWYIVSFRSHEEAQKAAERFGGYVVLVATFPNEHDGELMPMLLASALQTEDIFRCIDLC